MERPDLSQADSQVRAYIEYLERALAEAEAQAGLGPAEGEPAADLPPLEVSEPPTSLNLITLTRRGEAKRGPRHQYLRQRRGGMGALDLETADDDPVAGLVIADERAHLLVITSQARAFRLPVYFLDEAQGRVRPQPFLVSLDLPSGETWAAVLPAQTQGYLAVASVQGHVRVWPAHLFGETGRVGASVLRVDETGAPAAACWASGDSDLFMATRRGLAARFPLKSVPAAGAVGMRLEAGDAVVAITPVRADSGVFLVGADGRGSIRLMSGFNANKAPGVAGKLALKTDALIGAATVSAADDLFILSRLGKLIRFKANEVPAKEGVVQGVVSMSLRGDQCLALAVGGPAV